MCVAAARWFRVLAACQLYAGAAARRGSGGPCGRRDPPASWPRKVMKGSPGTAALPPPPPAAVTFGFSTLGIQLPPTLALCSWEFWGTQ